VISDQDSKTFAADEPALGRSLCADRDPNHPNLPRWPVFSTASVPTMMFDTAHTVRMNPDAAERRSTSGTA
jgi:hypothetical protein